MSGQDCHNSYSLQRTRWSRLRDDQAVRADVVVVIGEAHGCGPLQEAGTAPALLFFDALPDLGAHGEHQATAFAPRRSARSFCHWRSIAGWRMLRWAIRMARCLQGEPTDPALQPHRLRVVW